VGEPRFDDSPLAALVAAAAGEPLPALPRGEPLERELARIGGGFALAWQEDGRTTLAVDRFAIHTLCYRIDGDRLSFAARADELAGPAAEVDPQALFEYLFHHVIASPRTVFKGVQRLPAGHVAEFEAGRLTVRPWWRAKFEPAGNASFDSLAQRFRQLLEDSVRAEVGPHKPCAYLSGGTDSSTIAGMLRQATGQRPSTYSIGFHAAGYDEMEYARLAARHFDTDHHEYYVTPADLVSAIPMVAAAYDQPFGNSSAVPAYYCAKMAYDDGARRILAGDGGDELFGGNVRYAKQRVFSHYESLPRALRSGLLEPMAGTRAMQSLPLLRKAASYVNQAKVPMPARGETYNLLMRLGVQEVLTPAFRAAVDMQAPAVQQQQVWDETRASSFIDRQLAYDWRFTLAENDLPKVVGSAALAQLQVGFPMLGAALCDFSMTLPAHYKLRGVELRWFFKEALRGFLPQAIIAKKKHGFGLPFGVWATQDPALAALARDSLRSLAGRGIVEPEFIRKLLAEHLPAHPGYYGEMVWILLMLEQWLRARVPDWRLG
jgi:asparagine synthase (glutamine-hydrolysing)